MYVSKYRVPFICYDEMNDDKFVFMHPRDALNYMTSIEFCGQVLDARGTTISINQLRVEAKMFEKNRPIPGNKYSVDIHTDGACSGNPGPGGYGAIIVMNSYEKVVRGYEAGMTTNNRMELKAVVEAVKALKAPCNIRVHTDSQYLCTCGAHQDMAWFNQGNRMNKDLWFELLEETLAGKHHITFVKVAGHSGDYYNERCDKIAKEQVRKACHVLAGTNR